MKVLVSHLFRATTIVLTTATLLTVAPRTVAQNPQVEEKLSEIKQSAAANKQALAKYRWQEQETISIKGEVKNTKGYQVQMAPDGQQQKTEIVNQ